MTRRHVVAEQNRRASTVQVTRLRRHREEGMHDVPDTVAVDPKHRDMGDTLDLTELFVLVRQLREEIE